MDILCPKCGEPWDLDELHDAPGLTYDQASVKFRTEGCAVFGEKHAPGQPFRADAARVLYEVNGDDMDGAAAMLEDLEYGGLI